MSNGEIWAIVLAAGEGSRLRSLTTGHDGRTVPKQFCSLAGGPTLLEMALERARSVVDPERVVTVVAAEHHEHWEPLVGGLSAENVVVQPRNRGTGAGLLLPLLEVLERDPDARIAVLPSDHFVQSESILRVALFEGLERVRHQETGVVLLGVRPDEPVSDYGWIVSEGDEGRLHRIGRFVEKPRPAVSAELYEQGALWNTFLLTARGSALIELFARRLPRLLAQLRPPRGRSLARLYDALEPSDFSRDVLQHCEGELRMLELPPCGWTDLGTPQRVAECLARARLGRRWMRANDAARRTPVLASALRGIEIDAPRAAVARGATGGRTITGASSGAAIDGEYSRAD